jgi:Ras-related protein Rab-32
MDSRNNSEHLFKILVVGEASTGKTSFIKRYVHHFFSRAYKATIGVDFALKTMQYDERTIVRLQLWDIAGQERFGSMTRVYYKDAVGAFLVFDVNRPKTFESVLRWKNDLDTKVSLSDGSNIPCLLLANKCDLVQPSETDAKMLEEFTKQHGFIGYLYTSPKDNINIEQAARLLVREIMRRQENLEDDDLDDKNDTINMTEQYNRQLRNDQNSRNTSSCC